MRPLRRIEIILIALAVLGIVAFFVAWELTPESDPGDTAYRRGDFATAVAEWRAQAEAGEAAAQTKLGEMYETGKGVEVNPAEAAKWYRAAADQGHALGQNNLGRLLERGEGVGRNYGEAAKLYRAAAEQGNVRAQNNLANALRAGLGVPIDAVEALMWYEVAAARGSKLAERSRETAAKTMTPDQVREAKRRAAQWLAHHDDD